MDERELMVHVDEGAGKIPLPPSADRIMTKFMVKVGARRIIRLSEMDGEPHDSRGPFKWGRYAMWDVLTRYLR
eukprot:scaffold9546_cov157-Skeletonema_menzelii.AAC.7